MGFESRQGNGFSFCRTFEANEKCSCAFRRKMIFEWRWRRRGPSFYWSHGIFKCLHSCVLSLSTIQVESPHWHMFMLMFESLVWTLSPKSESEFEYGMTFDDSQKYRAAHWNCFYFCKGVESTATLLPWLLASL